MFGGIRDGRWASAEGQSVYVQADSQFPPAHRGREQPVGAQRRRRHDSARHAGQDHAGERALADQPVPSLSVGDRDRAAQARPLDRRSDGCAGTDRQEHVPAQRHLGMDRDVVPGKSWSAIRCMSCSRWHCCWSLSCSPANTKAGTGRCRDPCGADFSDRAGGHAQGSITVFTGMRASTCLALLFVPSFFVIMQGFEEWLAGRRAGRARAVPAE